MNKKNDHSDLGFWVLVIALFGGGAWPIAIPLALYKIFGPDKKKQTRSAPPLHSMGINERERYYEEQRKQQNASKARTAAQNAVRSPKPSKRNTILLTVFGCLLVLMAFSGFDDMKYYFTFWDLIENLAFLAGGAGLIAGAVGLKTAANRYGKYMAMIGSSQAVEIKSLAKKTGLSEKRVLKDLDKMIDKGYFGDGAYINNELGYLFLSTEADREVTKYRAAAAQKQKEAQEKDLADGYDKIISQIIDVNERIRHPEMSEKIYRIEAVTRSIFSIVQNEPKKRAMIDTFLSYYLPTTLKLLDSYASLEKLGDAGENIVQSKQSIENAMDSIVKGFENQLDDLYKSDVIDIETDIDVMTKMMNRNTAADDFKIAVDQSVPKKEEKSQFEKDFGLTYQTENRSFGTASGASATAQQTQKQ